MQIVRDLAGYTLGRSDLLRRAMSKKKAAVMEKNVRLSFMAMKEKAYRDVSRMELMKRLQIRFTMK